MTNKLHAQPKATWALRKLARHTTAMGRAECTGWPVAAPKPFTGGDIPDISGVPQGQAPSETYDDTPAGGLQGTPSGDDGSR